MTFSVFETWLAGAPGDIVPNNQKPSPATVLIGLTGQFGSWEAALAGAANKTQPDAD